MDLFVVPTIGFDLVYVLVIVRLRICEGIRARTHQADEVHRAQMEGHRCRRRERRRAARLRSLSGFCTASASPTCFAWAQSGAKSDTGAFDGGTQFGRNKIIRELTSSGTPARPSKIDSENRRNSMARLIAVIVTSLFSLHVLGASLGTTCPYGQAAIRSKCAASGHPRIRRLQTEIGCRGRPR
jgi:hypothetical protein